MSSDLILGVDPGERAGWAVLAGRDVLGVGVVIEPTRARRLESIGRVLEKAADIAEAIGIGRCIRIEDQFVGKNVQTTVTLVRLSYEWEILGTQRGFRVCRVGPSEWHRKLLPRGKKRVRDEVKRQASLVVRSLFTGSDHLSQDEVDAICIAVSGTGIDPNRLSGI